MTVAVVQSGEARTRWRDLLDSVYNGKQNIVIERYGKPVAALIAYEDFEALQKSLEDLQSTRKTQAMIEARQRETSLSSYQEALGNASGRPQWHILSEASLLRVWDNDHDAVYDNWRALYDVPEG